ncbi:MAG: hypothetical protein K6T34_07955 [Thermoflavifilum sp.]|nr:hypothetical protein [Thermoflavifilum sp.]
METTFPHQENLPTSTGTASFSEALFMSLAFTLALNAAHLPVTLIWKAGLLQGVLFALLLSYGAYHTQLNWLRPTPPFDETSLTKAIERLMELGLPEALCKEMVLQEWEENQSLRWEPVDNEHLDQKTISHIAMREALLVGTSALGGCAVVLVSYCFTTPSIAPWISLGIAMCALIALSLSIPHANRRQKILDWTLLLLMVSGCALLVGHLFYIS